MTDSRALLQQEIDELKQRVQAATLPEEMSRKMAKEIVALERSVELGSYDEKYEKVSRYIDWILKIPWQAETPDTLDIGHTREIFDKHHYGMQEVKDRFLEYVSILNLRAKQDPDSEFRAPILLLVGLVGTGKTTFAYSLAEALGRKLVRIPFGGLTSAKELRGNSRLLLGAEPGRVIKGICDVGVRNPVILLDEIDRVAEGARTTIMGVLVELLDPEQNSAFSDNFVDYPFDLSEVLFIATANNTGNISTAVLDRLEIIQMPSYSDDEKNKVLGKLGAKNLEVEEVENIEDEEDSKLVSRTSKVSVQRYKGLGEMNAEELWETTMDPKRRILKQVNVEEAADADRIFDILMGTDVPARKSFIQSNAKLATIDI